MGKLAGVISYDDNVKNQFKYTNTIGYTNRSVIPPVVAATTPVPIVPQTQRTIDTIERMFAGVKVLILNRSPKNPIIGDLNTINQALKDNNLYNDDMAPSFDLLNARAKSKAKGDKAWLTQTEVVIDDAITFI